MTEPNFAPSADPVFTEEEMGTTCCFATQDKVWVTAPTGERWEVYTVLDEAPAFAPPAGPSRAEISSQDRSV